MNTFADLTSHIYDVEGAADDGDEGACCTRTAVCCAITQKRCAQSNENGLVVVWCLLGMATLLLLSAIPVMSWCATAPPELECSYMDPKEATVLLITAAAVSVVFVCTFVGVTVAILEQYRERLRLESAGESLFTTAEVDYVAMMESRY